MHAAKQDRNSSALWAARLILGPFCACFSKAVSSKTRNRLLLVLAAFLFSTGGAAIKGTSMTSWQVAGFRSGIAALALWLLIPESLRQWTWRTLLIGITYAATLVLFVLATKLTTSSNAIFLQSTAPLYLLILGPLVLHEPIRVRDLAVMTGIGFGMWLLFSDSPQVTRVAPNPKLGNLLGALTGLSWAITLTGLRWFGKSSSRPESPLATVLAGNVLAFLICLPMSVPVEQSSIRDIAVLLYLGIVQIGLAYAVLTRSLRQVPAVEASTLLLVEPVFNPVWTWLIHGERPGNLALVGDLIILVTTVGATWWQAARSRGSGQ
jgi:DME family drug/metabolite transporter